jgi:hypothetical protein
MQRFSSYVRQGLFAILVACLTVLLMQTVPVLLAQVLTGRNIQFSGLTLRGGTNPFVGVPAYLKSVHITTATSTTVKNTPGVIGCVVVNTLGAGSLTLYNATSPVASYALAIIDTGAVKENCYGMIFSGQLLAVTSGTADVTITYR